MNYAGIQQAQQDAYAQQADVGGVRQQITQAIRNAAARTGVNFAYLMNKAQQESGGDPTARASTSTATGLFQFTGQTWLKMVKNYGAQYGVGNYAEHIKVDSDGTAHVNDPSLKKAILGLRNDPQLSAEMAGELDKENGAALKASVGGKIGSTELYLAHFLGASGASDFIQTLRSDPGAKAANILPEAAEANSPVFYDSDGNARSVSQIYQHFAQKFNKTPTDTSIMIASAAPVSTPSSATTAAASYAAMKSYMVADAYAARSSYAPAVTGDNSTDTTSVLASMLITQMKMDDASTSKLSLTGTSAYNKRNVISTLGAVA